MSEPANYSTIERAQVQKFAAELAGQRILSDHPDYETVRQINTWNPTTSKCPAMFARCANVEDVRRSIGFARENDLVLAVRSGGGSVLGQSICEGGIVIDLSPMKEVVINQNRSTVRVGGGLLTQELVAAVSPHGLAPVLGICPAVGVAGLTLGGGLGWLSGKYGAACDNLLSAEIITADGRILTASAEENLDLFWGISGGGGNFGIATALEFRLHPVGEVLAGTIKYAFSDARSVLRFYRDFMGIAPDEIWALAYAPGVGDPSVGFTVCYVGDRRRGEEVIRPLRAFGRPLSDSVQPRPYRDTVTMPLLEFAPQSFRAPKNCYLQRLSDEVIDLIIDHAAAAPSSRSVVGLDHYMHGAVCHVASHASAFELRETGGVHVWIESDWNSPEEAEESAAWATHLWDALQPYSGGRIYANYLSVEDEGSVRAAYGSNFSRLVTLKNKYDSSNFFSLNANIKPTSQL